MRVISSDTLRQELDKGIRGRLCVQAWLGYGEVLFLGFGDEVLPEPLPEEGHPDPPYELRTHFASWSVEEHSQIRGTGEDPREQALAACRLLVGHPAIDWSFDEAISALSVGFDGDLILKVVPWTDEEDPDVDAWMLKRPGGKYLGVACNRKLYFTLGDVPISNEIAWLRKMEKAEADSVGIALELSDAIEKEQAEHPDRVGASLIEGRSSPDPIVLETVLDCLPHAAVSEGAWREFVLRSLDHPEARIRGVGAVAAAELVIEEAIPALVRLLGDRDERVQVEAIYALRDLHARDASSSLVDSMTQDPRWGVRGRAARAIGTLLGEEAVPLLDERLSQERNPWAKTQLLIALYLAGRTERLPEILRRLSSKRSLLRLAVADCAQLLATPENYQQVVDALSRALEREQRIVVRREMERSMASLLSSPYLREGEI